MLKRSSWKLDILQRHEKWKLILKFLPAARLKTVGAQAIKQLIVYRKRAP